MIHRNLTNYDCGERNGPSCIVCTLPGENTLFLILKRRFEKPIWPCNGFFLLTRVIKLEYPVSSIEVAEEWLKKTENVKIV